ncbi:MAG: nucleotidyltransferase domain-containing protein [Bacillota bacterium]
MDRTIEALKRAMNAREEILFSYLFGSTAQGKENKLSDIDIAIFVDKNNMPQSGLYGYKSHVIQELTEAVGKEIDLVILNDAPVFLAYNIIKNGKLILCRAEKERINFHFKVLREYLDFQPAIVVQNEYLKKRLREGRFGGV